MTEEIHTVKRAIIMAAGIGKRMRPLTFTTPKPLIRVNGVRMIDSVVGGLRKNDIHEIYVVVGYLKEQFVGWAKDRNVTLIENPCYNTCNNISSLYVARELLSDCMILDGDQMIYNKAVLGRHFRRSGYNAVWCEGKTDEWLLEVKDGIVTSCSTAGGSRGWQLYSVSRWTAEDGIKLRTQLEHEFEAGNRQDYWDNIPMTRYLKEYKLGIWPMQTGDIVEVDDVRELIEIDHSYQGMLKKDEGGGLRE